MQHPPQIQSRLRVEGSPVADKHRQSDQQQDQGQNKDSTAFCGRRNVSTTYAAARNQAATKQKSYQLDNGGIP